MSADAMRAELALKSVVGAPVGMRLKELRTGLILARKVLALVRSWGWKDTKAHLNTKLHMGLA